MQAPLLAEQLRTLDILVEVKGLIGYIMLHNAREEAAY